MEVRTATAGDLTTVASALASGFARDPVMCWMSGQTDCEVRMTPFWRALVAAGLRRSTTEVHLSPDGATAAVWQGIDAWRVRPLEMLRTAPGVLRALRTGVVRSMRLLNALERAHPDAPHYYLEMLATCTGQQGKGSGSTVIAEMLDRCDGEGVPAYLESSNPRNVPFYARHGFVERDVVQAPNGGPSLITMWREPRSS